MKIKPLLSTVTLLLAAACQTTGKSNPESINAEALDTSNLKSLVRQLSGYYNPAGKAFLSAVCVMKTAEDDSSLRTGLDFTEKLAGLKNHPDHAKLEKTARSMRNKVTNPTAQQNLTLCSCISDEFWEAFNPQQQAALSKATRGTRLTEYDYSVITQSTNFAPVFSNRTLENPIVQCLGKAYNLQEELTTLKALDES